MLPILRALLHFDGKEGKKLWRKSIYFTTLAFLPPLKRFGRWWGTKLDFISVCMHRATYGSYNVFWELDLRIEELEEKCNMFSMRTIFQVCSWCSVKMSLYQAMASEGKRIGVRERYVCPRANSDYARMKKIVLYILQICWFDVKLHFSQRLSANTHPLCESSESWYRREMERRFPRWPFLMAA